MDDFNSMKSLTQFFGKSLKKLTLLQQSVSVIDGLEKCPKLEEIWLDENRIAKLEPGILGLIFPQNLRVLSLTSNIIGPTLSIPGIISFVNLTTLLLADNRIEYIEDDLMKQLPKLTVLNLACNRLTSVNVSTFFQSNSLESLNLAANNIRCFLDYLCGLVNCENLKHFWLDDADWGRNPVCRAQNYRSFSLYFLPKLLTLDGFALNEKVESTEGDEAIRLSDMSFWKVSCQSIKHCT